MRTPAEASMEWLSSHVLVPPPLPIGEIRGRDPLAAFQLHFEKFQAAVAAGHHERFHANNPAGRNSSADALVGGAPWARPPGRALAGTRFPHMQRHPPKAGPRARPGLQSDR